MKSKSWMPRRPTIHALFGDHKKSSAAHSKWKLERTVFCSRENEAVLYSKLGFERLKEMGYVYEGDKMTERGVLACWLECVCKVVFVVSSLQCRV